MSAAIRTGKPVNRLHHRWRPTASIAAALVNHFPHLEFPYLDADHTHGVHSSIHCFCPRHNLFTRVSLICILSDKTRYACQMCALEAGIKTRKAGGFSTKQYIGKPGVQSGIFRAVKEVFNDAVWEHTMRCGKEIDVWVPSINAGVEYNGNYYHSTAIQKDGKYHAKKSLLGQKEGQGIFHVFTDEAVSPYLNIVRVLQMSAGAFTYEPNKRDTISVCDPLTAFEFYKEWNYIHPKFVSEVCDTHIGLFRRGNLIAVISGIRSFKKVLRTSTRLYGVPLADMLKAFQIEVGGNCTVWADWRNPVEVNSWLNSPEIRYIDYRTPVGFHLDSGYSIVYNSNSDLATDTMLFDCGHHVLSL
jgi:hypothetical protein